MFYLGAASEETENRSDKTGSNEIGSRKTGNKGLLFIDLNLMQTEDIEIDPSLFLVTANKDNK